MTEQEQTLVFLIAKRTEGDNESYYAGSRIWVYRPRLAKTYSTNKLAESEMKKIRKSFMKRNGFEPELCVVARGLLEVKFS